MPWAQSSLLQKGDTILPLSVAVTRLSGEPLCAIKVDIACTVEALKYAIQQETNIPLRRQSLIRGNDVTPLQNENAVKDLTDGKPQITLSLIQIHKAPLRESETAVPPTALKDAISSNDTDQCLTLLTYSPLPGLNCEEPDGSSVLHLASWNGLADVCQELLERSDFTLANALDQNGFTALHCATLRDNGDVARVLLSSSAFTSADSCYAQFNPHDAGGWSASQLARLKGNADISDMIDAFCAGKFK